MKTPARLRCGGTPHEENIASRRATSLGGGAMSRGEDRGEVVQRRVHDRDAGEVERQRDRVEHLPDHQQDQQHHGLPPGQLAERVPHRRPVDPADEVDDDHGDRERHRDHDGAQDPRRSPGWADDGAVGHRRVHLTSNTRPRSPLVTTSVAARYQTWSLVPSTTASTARSTPRAGAGHACRVTVGRREGQRLTVDRHARPALVAAGVEPGESLLRTPRASGCGPRTAPGW